MPTHPQKSRTHACLFGVPFTLLQQSSLFFPAQCWAGRRREKKLKSAEGQIFPESPFALLHMFVVGWLEEGEEKMGGVRTCFVCVAALLSWISFHPSLSISTSTNRMPCILNRSLKLFTSTLLCLKSSY